MVCEESYLHEPLTSCSMVLLVLDDGTSPRLGVTDVAGTTCKRHSHSTTWQVLSEATQMGNLWR